MQIARKKKYLFEYIIIIVFGSFLSGWVAWTVIKYEERSGFDSGWIIVDNKTSHVVSIAHNLGSVPKELFVWFSPTKNGDVSFLVTHNWNPGDTGNPVSIYADKTAIKLAIFVGAPLRGVWAPGSEWKQYKEGYFRVIAK